MLDGRLDKKAAYRIAISVWEQLPNPNIRNCTQIGRLVKNEPDIEMAIADEIQNFKKYGVPQLTRSTDLSTSYVPEMVYESVLVLDLVILKLSEGYKDRVMNAFIFAFEPL